MFALNVSVKIDSQRVTTKLSIIGTTVVSPQNLPNSPPHISLEKIHAINNKRLLKNLEKRYDEFIEKNAHILNLHGTSVENYLEIRDALTIKVLQMEREEKMNYLYTHL
jgi:hypothetical protein